MTQGDESEIVQEIVAGSEATPRRRRHSHRKHRLRMTPKNRKKIRTAVIVGICVLLLVIFWYYLISTPTL
jgi:hypothetical protein